MRRMMRRTAALWMLLALGGCSVAGAVGAATGAVVGGAVGLVTD